MSEYETKAQVFLDKYGLKVRATFKGDRSRVTIWRPGIRREPGRSRPFDVVLGGKLIDTVWAGGPADDVRRSLVEHDGYDAGITVRAARASGGRLSFDFWNSQKDMQEGKAPTAYDVLACISGDVNCPDTFEDFCGEYGYDLDSRKAFATFKRCATFAERLQAFFTEEEREALAEIQ